MRHPIGAGRGSLARIDPFSPWGRLVAGGAAFLALLAFGVAGYMAIEAGPFWTPST